MEGSPSSKSTVKVSWLERISALLMREPEDREQLVDLLHSAFERNLMDADALSMIEGVLQVSDMRVVDIMVPRAQIDAVDLNDSIETFLPMVLETAHSRFPVFDGEKDRIQGILLAKDLLRYFADPEKFDLRDMLRPVVFIPESKRLNVLLKEFRSNRNHMAIVVDEYGGVSGLVTIEDVIEQIVGDIEDEYDFDETEDNLVEERDGSWRVKAVTEISDANEVMHAQLPNEQFETIGELVVDIFGYVPKRGESVSKYGWQFEVVRADSRQVHTLLISPADEPTPADERE
ncbi:CBS domain-containing protein [Leeia sp. TBRC 13508]|uniref:Magnesium and cobalt efflux protein CorC n=1 Tax=Leeia speluncae TaxID=2884804 RepID=A0ABS8D5C2_9NEIS|nr:transporter associated domain-containing protein [Leeia speluncae]MCB6183406.1 CBS domain-containing protein [Leeia speluncae]